MLHRLYPLAFILSAASAEPFLVVDPPVELTRTLSDERGSSDGIRWINGSRTVEWKEAPVVNDFPFVRFRLGGAVEDRRRVLVSVQPYDEANTRSVAAPLDSGGREYGTRLPPDRILSDQPYREDGEWRFEFEDNRGRLALDYVMADRVRTAGLAEFDSTYPEVIDVSPMGSRNHRYDEGLLRLLADEVTQIDFPVSGYAAEHPFDSVELRLRLTDQPGTSLPLRLSWQGRDGEPDELAFDVPADGAFHIYRIYLQKHLPASEHFETITLGIPENTLGTLVLDIDYVRLRDFPNAGGGFISKGIFEMGRQSEDWEESARLIDRWRLVAGQGYKGNLARLWQTFGRVFREQGIRWEIDHMTWQWIIDKSEWPRTAAGDPDLRAAARLAYDDINPSGEFLAKRGSRLHAVHFDGLLKRLIMPWGHPHDEENPRSPDGGLFEHADGDYDEAYRLAAETFCEFLALCRNEPDSALKETRFYIQPNFHVWGWEYGALKFRRPFTNLPDPGNFHRMMEVLEATDRRYIAEGRYDAPSPLAGYGADWVFLDAQKRRLVSFEWASTEEFGREFNVVNNGELRAATGAERAIQTLEYLEEFLARGGRPTTFTPYYWQGTWTEDPAFGDNVSAVLPETQPYTFLWTILESARRALFLQNELPSSIPEPPGRP